MTNPKAWLLLIPAVLVEVTASLALKGATAVGSLLIFGEPITTLMGIGIMVIIGGVLLIELGAPH